MRKIILFLFLLIQLLTCKSEKTNKFINMDTSEFAKTEHNTKIGNQSNELDDAANTNDILFNTDFEEDLNNFDPEKQTIYTFDKLKEEYKTAY